MIPPEQLPQLIDAFTRLPRTAFQAVLLDLAGLPTEARRMRVDAWRSGADAEALLHLTLAQAYDQRTADGMAAMARQVAAGVRDGVVDPDDAADVYVVAWAACHAFLGDPNLADWFLLRRESLYPGSRFPSVARTSETSHGAQIIAAATCLLAASQIEEDAASRARHLLRLEIISPPAVAPKFSHIRTALKTLGDGADDAGLSLALCELDRLIVANDPAEHAETLRLCDELYAAARDERSRAALRFRKIYLTAQDDIGAALSLSDEFSDSAGRHGQSEATQEFLYLQALVQPDLETAASIALARAKSHHDLRFVAAWAIRGLTQLRDADRSLEDVAHHGRIVLDRCRALRRDAPVVYEILEDFTVGATLHSSQPEQALSFVSSMDSREFQLLRTMFWLDNADLSLDQFSDLALSPTLRAFFASRAAENPGIDIRHPLFEKFGDSPHEFTLSQYVSFFVGQDTKAVWERAKARFEHDATIQAEDLWVAWAAARALSQLDAFVDQLIPMQRKVTATALTHCRAALAESLSELGERADAERILEGFPDAAWAEAIRRRAEKAEKNTSETGSWTICDDAHAMTPEASDVRTAIEAARQVLRRGRPRSAARGFFEASKLTDDRELRGKLLFMAARAIEEADAFSLRAIDLYRRSLEFSPQQARALSRLLALLARREQWHDLVATAQQRDAETRLSADTRWILEEAAIQLASSDPAASYAAWTLVLERIAISDGFAETLRRFERAGQAALAADKLDDFEALLERLHARFEDTAISSAFGLARHQFRKVVESLGDPLQAIERSGFDPRVIRIATRRLLEQRSHVEIIDALVRLSEKSPEAREALLEEIIVLIDSSELSPDERIERLAELEAASNNPWLGIAKANAYGMNGDYEAAAATLEAAARSVEDHIDRAEIYRQLGRLYEEELENTEVALENYLVSFICDSGNPSTLALLESMYTSRQRHADLVGAYDVAIAHIEERNPSELDEATLRAKRAAILKNTLDELNGFTADRDWLLSRSNMPRSALNVILEELRDEFDDDKLAAWVGRLDVEFDLTDDIEPDAVIRWARATRPAPGV